jgi:hypothetical protein
MRSDELAGGPPFDRFRNLGFLQIYTSIGKWPTTLRAS